MGSETFFTITPPVLPVLGETRSYPVRRVFCVGRNYAAHAREMGSDPSREPPFYFTKSADSLVPGGGTISYAQGTANLHHEVELVVALDQGGIFGYGLGLDMTRRDLQAAAREKSQPWDLAKSFEQSAPITPLIRDSSVWSTGEISLDVNGTRRQTGDIAQMIWAIPEIIAHLSGYYHLGPGDIIFTGTPDGVGPVVPGDRISARFPGLPLLEVAISN